MSCIRNDAFAYLGEESSNSTGRIQSKQAMQSNICSYKMGSCFYDYDHVNYYQTLGLSCYK